MPEQPTRESQSGTEVQAHLHELAQVLREAHHLEPEAQQALADLVDELSKALTPAGIASSETTHLANTAATLARTLHQETNPTLLSAAKQRLEQAALRAEAQRPSRPVSRDDSSIRSPISEFDGGPMSPEPASATVETPAAWPVLSVLERRVLGVLVEKAKSTPDIYPLSLNSLVTGCNQKSNRDPLLNVSDFEVEDALASAQKRGLVIKITGGRVERWRHILYEAWRVEKVELAVLAELLLRGPQTEGELRSRASRMEPIADLDALRAVLKLLAERRLAVYLTPEGRRGTVVTHGFHEPREWERLRAHAGAEAESPARDETPGLETRPGTSTMAPAWEASLNEVNAQIASLRGALSDLESNVASLTEQVRAIKEGLGM